MKFAVVSAASVAAQLALAVSGSQAGTVLYDGHAPSELNAVRTFTVHVPYFTNSGAVAMVKGVLASHDSTRLSFGGWGGGGSEYSSAVTGAGLAGGTAGGFASSASPASGSGTSGEVHSSRAPLLTGKLVEREPVLSTPLFPQTGETAQTGYDFPPVFSGGPAAVMTPVAAPTPSAALGGLVLLGGTLLRRLRNG